MAAHEQVGEDDLAKLVLDLETLEEGRHELAVTLPKAWVAEALTETDATADEDGRALLEVMLQADRTVLVRGRIEQRYAVPCARCLEPAKVDAGAETGELCVTFVPADRLRSWAAELAGTGAGTDDSPETDDDIDPLEPDELDQIGYQGQRIDLRALLAEQILITYPMRALCSRGEACRGLCSGCGADLNAMADDAERCSSCGRRLDGRDEDVVETPWKRALSKLDQSGGNEPDPDSN